MQDPRTLGVLEACQVVTVEDFFRTSFEVIQKQQRDSFSPAAKLQSAKTRIENAIRGIARNTSFVGSMD